MTIALDITTPTTYHEIKAALFPCPYCHRQITPARRVAYPERAIGAYAPVYRCLCGKFIGAPVTKEEG